MEVAAKGKPGALHRLGTLLTRILELSPEARVFFYTSSLVHAQLKVLLGLTMVFEDRYGFRSLLAPPQSLVFAGGDIAVCFLVAKVLDLCVPARKQRLMQALVSVPLFVFLLTNFIVHGYFKAFVNAGLLEFNGAGAHEITDYTIAGFNVYSVTFVVLSVATLALGILLHPQLTASRFVQRKHASTVVLCAGFAAMGYVGTLSAGQSGFMARNPGFELLRSYTQASGLKYRRATAAESEAFATPTAMFGTYDTSFPVRIPSQRGKNVLFVLIESLPFEQTSLEDPKNGFPFLRKLAENGVTFTNFRTVFPATSRSFLTYHCGMYPTTGAATVTKYLPDYRCDSLVDLAKEAGYRTGFFTAPMFTYDNLHKARVMKSYDRYEDFLTLRERARHGRFDAPAVEEEAVTKALTSFIGEDRTKPFFATYFMFWNHAPYRLPFADISGLSPLERYHKTLAYLDRVFSDLYAQLAKDGLLDDTLIVVAADHGEGFALHHDNTNHVGHIYEDDVRVPLLVHVPGLGQHTSARQGSNVDFAPTMAALLGFPRPASWEGQDLTAEHFEARPTLLFGRASFATSGLVDGQFKYIEYADGGHRALYDLSVDPHEQTNLIARFPEQAKAYAALVERWLAVADYRAFAVNGR